MTSTSPQIQKDITGKYQVTLAGQYVGMLIPVSKSYSRIGGGTARGYVALAPDRTRFADARLTTLQAAAQVLVDYAQSQR